MTISKQGVANGDPFELIKLSYALNKKKFTEAFDKVKIKINSEEDLRGLADMAIAKLDVSGAIKDGEVIIVFDTMRIVDGLKDYLDEEIESVKPLLID